MRAARVFTSLALCLIAAAHGLRPPARFGSRHHAAGPPFALNQALLSQCKLHHFEQTLDHFGWEHKPDGCKPTFPQRYFLCGKHWAATSDAPIFLYLGNEADVILYLNNSGLMWENAQSFGALLVFAEHRYYGVSQPVCPPKHFSMHFLTTEQALADYAALIMDLKHRLKAPEAPVIGFGGSYGGMLAAWFRMKYPHLLDGAIAASAPIWNFEGEDPPFNPLAFRQGVTYDASEAGGSTPHCVDNVRATWKVVDELGATSKGRATLNAAFRVCPAAELLSADNVTSLKYWLAGAWDSMAMGNYPYPSGYILNGAGELPAFPVRVACSHLAAEQPSEIELLQGMQRAAGVFYNYTKELKCFDYSSGANEESDQVEDYWNYQYCTEQFMPFGTDGVTDMFWREDWNATAAIQSCQAEWGVTPRPLWATTEWGGKRIGTASRIAFSNGLLDPWHGGGVLQDVNEGLEAIIIPEGAHHLDLMFSRAEDTAGVRQARAREVQLIHAGEGRDSEAIAASTEDLTRWLTRAQGGLHHPC